MLQEKEYQNKKGKRFCVQSVGQETRSYSRTGEQWHALQRKKHSRAAYRQRLQKVQQRQDRQRDVKRIFKMLREVWLNIRVEKVDTHKGVIVKVLLDSGTTEIFMDKKIAAKHGFKLQKLDKPVIVRNVNRTNNSRGAITHQVEVNVYYKSHVERIRIDICDLGRTGIILEMPWLQVHNSKIDQETGEVKITRCPLICRRQQ